MPYLKGKQKQTKQNKRMTNLTAVALSTTKSLYCLIWETVLLGALNVATIHIPISCLISLWTDASTWSGRVDEGHKSRSKQVGWTGKKRVIIFIRKKMQPSETNIWCPHHEPFVKGLITSCGSGTACFTLWFRNWCSWIFNY